MPHPVDIHVGKRLRILRAAKGVSQSYVAEAVGLTFQQVQKYEKGSNRISASKLYELAALMGVEISFFFEGFDEGRLIGAEDLNIAVPSRDDFALAHELAAVKDTRIKKAVLALLKDA